jgi:hypothetical protein
MEKFALVTFLLLLGFALSMVVVELVKQTKQDNA